MTTSDVTDNELLRYEVVGSVAVIALDAPHRNALNPHVCAAILTAIERSEADPDVTAIVIASDGEGFCSGADLGLLREVALDPLEQSGYEALGVIYSLFERIQVCSLPTVSAVNGAIIGAGINLALVCDVRIVADDLVLEGFGKAGVHPGGGHLSMLTHRVGHHAAAAIALFGRAVDAAEAVHLGFAIESVPLGDLRTRAVAVAARVGTDKALVEATVRSFRAVGMLPLTPAAATQLERAPQVWSLRRRMARQRPKYQTGEEHGPSGART